MVALRLAQWRRTMISSYSALAFLQIAKIPLMWVVMSIQVGMWYPLLVLGKEENLPLKNPIQQDLQMPAYKERKLIEGVINSTIKQHLCSNGLITETQFEFCQGHSTPDLISALLHTWTEELNSRGE
eukprot:g38938.t1